MSKIRWHSLMTEMVPCFSVKFWVRSGSGRQRHFVLTLYMHVQDFARSLSSLEYEDDPDYSYLLRLLESLLEELGVQVS